MKTILMGLMSVALGLCLCVFARYTHIRVGMVLQIPYAMPQTAQRLTVRSSGWQGAQATLRKIYAIEGVEQAVWVAEIDEAAALYLWDGLGHYAGVPLQEGGYFSGLPEGGQHPFLAKEGSFLHQYAAENGGACDLYGKDERLVGVYGADHPFASTYWARESVHHYAQAQELRGVYYIDAQPRFLAALAAVFREDGYSIEVSPLLVPRGAVLKAVLDDALYRLSLLGVAFALFSCFFVCRFLCLDYARTFAIHWRFGGHLGAQLRRLSGPILAAAALGSALACALYAARFAHTPLALGLPTIAVVILGQTLLMFALFAAAFLLFFHRDATKGAGA